jgi:hypothetical protein
MSFSRTRAVFSQEIAHTFKRGEERTVAIACPFRPGKVIVDPDVQVLQLRRKAAVASL